MNKLPVVLWFVLVSLPVCGADQPDPEPPAADLKKLEGEWQLTSLRRGGRESKLPAGIDFTMTITRDKLTTKTNVRGKTREVVNTFKLGARKSPRHIDRTSQATRLTTHGIYKLEKDELTMAVNRGADRPKDFTTAMSVMVFKRKK